MSMGKQGGKQRGFWVDSVEVSRGPGHPFHEALNRLLSKHGFDAYVEELCRPFYAAKMGRPSLPPGVYFRLLLVGYFEGIDSERGIAWRLADSITLREFLGLELSERTPDHSTISRNRRLIAWEAHRDVFTWILTLLGKEGLLRGKTLGIDATTLEANAAMRSIVRRDTGEGYPEFLTRLAKESGIETPTRQDLARFDRKRPKKASNDEWRHPYDSSSRIAKMKDGRTHMAHKAEHAVDLETGAIVAVTLQPADRGDTKSVEETFESAIENLSTVVDDDDSRRRLSPKVLAELVADRGYNSAALLTKYREGAIRTYIPEPKRRGRRKWHERRAEQRATCENRRRVRGERGKALARRRCELVERSFAHGYGTGGMRRTHLRDHHNIGKRLLIHLGGLNLGLVLRKRLGAGTPRELRNALRRLYDTVFAFLRRLITATEPQPLFTRLLRRFASPRDSQAVCSLTAATSTTAY